MSDDSDQPAGPAGTDAAAAVDERAPAGDGADDASATDGSDGATTADAAPGATASSPLATGVPEAFVGRPDAAATVSDGRLLAPAVLAGCSLALAAAAPGAFDLASGGVERLLGGSLLAALALASAWATLGLFDDADARANATGVTEATGTTDAAWRPDHWRYVAGGAGALLAVRLGQLWTGAVAPARPVPYLAGSAVVAALLAPVLAGPAYVLARRRATPAEDEDSTGR